MQYAIAITVSQKVLIVSTVNYVAIVCLIKIFIFCKMFYIFLLIKYLVNVVK